MTLTYSIVCLLCFATGIIHGWYLRTVRDRIRRRRVRNRTFNIGADLTMHNEMFMASPDGERERERIKRVLEEHGTPGSFEFRGYFDDGKHHG